MVIVKSLIHKTRQRCEAKAHFPGQAGVRSLVWFSFTHVHTLGGIKLNSTESITEGLSVLLSGLEAFSASLSRM